MKILVPASVLAMLLATPVLAGQADTPFANQTIQPPVQDRVTGDDPVRTGTKADPSLKTGDDLGATTRAITADPHVQIERPAVTDPMTGGLRPDRRTY